MGHSLTRAKAKKKKGKTTNKLVIEPLLAFKSARIAEATLVKTK